MRLIGGVLIGLSMLASACATPKRVALTSPWPLTYGGTSIPAKGAVIGLGLADGLRGQELERAEQREFLLGVGVADRVSMSASGFWDAQLSEAGGQVWRIKARLGDLFGPRSSVAAHVAVARASRADLPAQDETLLAIDVAVPAEFLLTRPGSLAEFGVYVGPRVTRESYRDRLDARHDLRQTYAGALGGVHLRYRFVHLFGEATVIYVPEHSYRNASYGGRLTVMPAAGVLLRIGKDHAWK